MTAATEEEIDAFFEENKARINQPREQISEQIRGYLDGQKRTELLQGLYASLRSKYEVETFLEPIRISVAADGHPAVDPADAPVTIVEFSDFQCPYCSRVTPTLKKVVDEYEGQVRLVFRQFPLRSIHPMAQKAAEASLCAADQGKFWEMHDLMFADQRQLGDDNLMAMAATLEIDAESFNECLTSGQHEAAVEADLQAGQAAGVSGTPAMFVNGRFASGALPYDQLAAMVDEEIARDAR
jgi:protein-disulfide isomerase